MNIYSSQRKRLMQAAGKFQILLISTAVISTFALIPLPGISWAATHTAASCSAADVNSAIDAASSGDIVSVMVGACSWSAGININKSITLQGGGIDSTTISSPSIKISSTNARITGFTFSGGNISAGAENFRIDSNKFLTSGESITTHKVYGLIDNNTFNFSGSSTEVIKIYGPDDSWTTEISYGTGNAVYVENNTFTTTQGLGSSQAVQGNYNARFVVRYNTITNAKIDAHGIWSNGSPSQYCNWGYSNIHSARHFEIYGNGFKVYPDDGNQYYWITMELRGGSGIVFDNTFSGSSRYNSSEPAYPSIKLVDYCTVVKDGNCCGVYLTPDEYPYHDQLGRGKNQTLEPLYIWNYTINGSWTETSRVNWPSAAAKEQYGEDFTADDIVKKNRDYYEYTSSFDGSAGVGVGLLADRPATCTAGVAYWATDQKKLYKATAENTWTEYYTPYTYPHPLRSVGQEIQPPTGLTAKELAE